MSRNDKLQHQNSKNGTDNQPETNPDGTPSYYKPGDQTGSKNLKLSPKTNPQDNPLTPEIVRNTPQFTQDRSGASAAASSADVGGSETADALNLVGSQIPFNKQSCTVVGRIICRNEYLYALESDKPMTGYDGLCPKCRQTHVRFPDSRRGFYASVKSIHDKFMGDQINDERSTGPKTIDQLKKVTQHSPPLSNPITGPNKGIEGDANSCYMDSTIFCMFAYSGVFDTLLNKKIQDDRIERLQTLLRENIVNVLRSEDGFVERDALIHLRQSLSDATGDKTFIQEEKDPSEFLRALEKLFHFAPLKTIPPDQLPTEDQSNITPNIMWEMFDANVQGHLSINIGSVFRNSLAEIPAKLATIPPFLILVAPRYSRTDRSYRYIIPDRQITLDHQMVQLVCQKCKRVHLDDSNEFYSCYSCPPRNPKASVDAFVHSYCYGCSDTIHNDQERVTHKLKQMRKIATMNLFAVLCIERCHYVAFVKCRKQNNEHEWLFFDSMSDRVAHEKNIPSVTKVPQFEQWIEDAERDKDFFKKIEQRRNSGLPTAKAFPGDEMTKLRLFRDDTFFFYENSIGNYH